jgi:hypothetical protein
MTERAPFDFTVRTFASGTPWIMAEQMSGNMLLGGVLGFDLKTGTTLEEARTIAQFMQKHIVGLVLTL